MDYYLIDYENTGENGLKGITELNEDSCTVVFYSENADKISFDMHQKLCACRTEIEYRKINTGKKNALDFQLSTYLGYLIAVGQENQFYIVSKDNGYRVVMEFWKDKKVRQIDSISRVTAKPLMIEAKKMPDENDKPAVRDERAFRGAERAASREEISAFGEEKAAVKEETSSLGEGRSATEEEMPFSRREEPTTAGPALNINEENGISSDIPKNERPVSDGKLSMGISFGDVPEELSKELSEKQEAEAVRPDRQEEIQAPMPTEQKAQAPMPTEQKAQPPMPTEQKAKRYRTGRRKKDADTQPADEFQPSEELRQALSQVIGDGEEREHIGRFIVKYKTKQGVNNAIVKLYGTEKAGELYKKIKPFLKDKKGK